MGERTRLTIEDIMEILEFTLTTTYFREQVYQQEFCTAMGSLVPLVANLYKEGLSQQVKRTFNKHGINTAFKSH